MDSRDMPRPGGIVPYEPPRPPILSVSPVASRPAAPPVGLKVIARGLVRWWWQALTAWVLGTAALVGTIWAMFGPTYEASSLIRVEPTPQELFGAGGAATNSGNFQNYLETQIQLVTSPNVLLTAASNPQEGGLAGIRRAADPEAVLRRMLEVKLLPKSYLIKIATTSPTPVEAAGVVNAVTDAYLKADAEWSDGMTRNQIKNLETYLKNLQGQIDEKRKAWLAVAERGNAMASPAGDELALAKASVTFQEYQQLQQRLLQVELDLTEAEAQARAARDASGAGEARDSGAGLERRIEQEFRRDPEVVKLVEQLDQVDAQIAKADRRIRNGLDPTMRHLRASSADLEGRRGELWRSKYESIRDRLTAVGPDEGRAAAGRAAARVASLRTVKAKLEARLGSIEVADREQGTDAVKATLIRSDLGRLEEMQGTVNRRLEQLRFEARGQARIRKISEARAPSQPSADKRPKLLAMAPAGMFFLIVGLTTLLEARAGRVAAPDDLSRRMVVDVFAVPPLPSPRPARGAVPDGLLEDFVHRIDHIREAICGGLRVGGLGRCVVITSAVGGEGKTTLASQLAVRCANAGAMTLLIDADLRRASLAHLFGVPDGPGLAEVLSGEAKLEDALVPIGQMGCHLLPAGQPDPNPARLILGRQLGPLLERLRRSYEVVIIDTPPVLPVPDALTMGRWADGILMATRHDVSRLHLVEQAARAIRSAGIPVLGAVVQGVRPAAISGGGYASSYRSGRPQAP